jgi:Sec-independent protein translocase protein TatA
MEILGVGLPEMFFIVLIALILLGPKEMLEASRTIGRALRKFITSPTWQAMRATGQELQQLPTKLMREAGLEELDQMRQEVQGATKELQEAASMDPRAVNFSEKQIFADLNTPSPAPAKPASPLPETPPAPPPDSSSERPQA